MILFTKRSFSEKTDRKKIKYVIKSLSLGMGIHIIELTSWFAVYKDKNPFRTEKFKYIWQQLKLMDGKKSFSYMIDFIYEALREE